MPDRCHPEPFDRLRTGSAEGSKALGAPIVVRLAGPPPNCCRTVGQDRGFWRRDQRTLLRRGLRFLDSARKDAFTLGHMSGGPAPRHPSLVGPPRETGPPQCHWFENVIPVRHVILEPQAKNLKRWRRPFASLKGDKAGRFSSSWVAVQPTWTIT